jgi:hypothetical protein
VNLANTFDIRNAEDWYSIKKVDVEKCGGKSVLNIYGGSLQRALAAIYPDFQWDPFKFKHNPKGMYEDINKKRSVLNEIAEQLCILSNTVTLFCQCVCDRCAQ